MATRNHQPARAITKAQIQYIQCVRRSAGIDDATYDAMKKSVGVCSTTELDQRQFNELLRRIGKLKSNSARLERPKPESYKPVHSSAFKSGMHVAPPEDKAAMLAKIEAILADMKLPWPYADGIAKKMFGVDLVRWCDGDQTYRVLQALCIYQRRKGAKMNETAFYIGELKGDGCQCGAKKKPGQPFCYRCYRTLPEEMRKALYRRVGNGYEQAYDAAVAWLTGEGS